MRSKRPVVRAATLVAVDLGVLAGLRPRWPQVVAEVCSPRSWAASVGVDGLLGDLGAAVLWLLAAWLLLAIGTGWATLLPGIAGRLAARAERRMLPGAARRLLAGAAGLGVLLAPVAAAAGTVGTSSNGTVGISSTGTVRANETTIANRLDGTPAPRWPQSPVPGTHHPRPPAPAADTDAVTVRPGDSLWLIAQRRLGASAPPREIAATWPRWYAANRQAVGTDPGHITPGEVLRVPSGDHTTG